MFEKDLGGIRGDVRGKKTMGLTKTPSLYQAPKAEHFKFLLMHSVISGGGPGCVKGGWGYQSWEDYGLKSLRNPQVSIKSQS